MAKAHKWFKYNIEPSPTGVRPLFIWAGGKSKMWFHYKEIISQFQFDNYCEPFFGGGATLLKVLEENQHLKKRIVINDINDDIIRIYKSIQSDVDAFVQEMDRIESEYIPLNKEERSTFYFDFRKEHAFDYKKWEDTPTIEASHLYFLMKTGFNGIWQVNKNTGGRYGTPAGLLDQKKHVYDKKNVFAWNRLLQNVEIYSEDWKTCVDRIKEDNTFFFFDPPYRGGFADYDEGFDDDKQIELVKWCNNLQNSHTFFCNRDLGDGFFEKHRGELKMKKLHVTYTAGRKKKTDSGFEAMPATEILLYK